MPKSITMDLRCVLASGAALAVAAMCCPSANAIVGGTTVSLDQHPYQVALVRAGLPAVDDDGQYCGGSIRDEWHIITAAHCVFDNPASPSGQPMTAAADRRSRRHREPRQRGRARPARARGADLLRPLVQRGSRTTGRCSPWPRRCSCRRRSAARAGQQRELGRHPAGSAAVRHRLGRDAAGTGPVISLRGVQVKNVSDTTCNATIRATSRRSRSTARSRPARATRSSGGKDACQGDSGGPLVKANGAASDRGRRAGRHRLLRRRLRPRRLPGRLHRGGGALDPGLPHARQPPCRSDQHVGAHAGRNRGDRPAADLLARRVDGRTHVLLPVRPLDRPPATSASSRPGRSRPTSSRRGRGDRAALRGLRRQPRRRERRLERAEPPRARPRRRSSAADIRTTPPRTATRPSLA